ncbi:MAG: hypothetical protein JKY10_04200 [Cohaesibacteraceae bacterium]|nr:hypothetical protein [Cohaesibacteraceae bacterium]
MFTAGLACKASLVAVVEHGNNSPELLFRANEWLDASHLIAYAARDFD